MHVDGDAFFVSCEVTRRPDLRGRPVVTGQERGIATAVSPQAKALGVTRATRIRDIRRLYPQVVILSSHYDLYAAYARRMYDIVRKYSDEVEEYSIDECFALLPARSSRIGKSDREYYESLARAIQVDLHTSLGMTFGVGLGVNKVTAKIASKWRKPAGFTSIGVGDIPTFLSQLSVGKIWGIGSATTARLRQLGITTALDLHARDRVWVGEHCDRPLAEIWEEFHGAYVKKLSTSAAAGGFSGGLLGDAGRDFASVQRTRTFYPPTRDPAFLWSHLSYYAEDACARLRHAGRLSRRVSFFLKTQDFQYLRREAELADAAVPEAVLAAIRPAFEAIIKSVPGHLKFRAAGITLSDIRAKGSLSGGLFGEAVSTKSQSVHEAADRLARKFGREALFLGSSMKARSRDREARDSPASGIIFLGEV